MVLNHNRRRAICGNGTAVVRSDIIIVTLIIDEVFINGLLAYTRKSVPDHEYKTNMHSRYIVMSRNMRAILIINCTMSVRTRSGCHTLRIYFARAK